MTPSHPAGETFPPGRVARSPSHPARETFPAGSPNPHPIPPGKLFPAGP
jgi:hypothetical protein